MPTRIRKDIFLQSLDRLRAGHNLCHRREMAVFTNNGLVNGPLEPAYAAFTLCSGYAVKPTKKLF